MNHILLARLKMSEKDNFSLIIIVLLSLFTFLQHANVKASDNIPNVYLLSDNLALNKRAIQSGDNSNAGLAVDGNDFSIHRNESFDNQERFPGC